jgi:hypothetical protein
VAVREHRALQVAEVDGGEEKEAVSGEPALCLHERDRVCAAGADIVGVLPKTKERETGPS